MPKESMKNSHQPRDARILSRDQIQQELERGRTAAENERTAALGALRTAQAGKIRVLERELARRERKGQAQSPAAAGLRQRLDHLRVRSAVFDNRRARACREWPEPMKDTWILHGFVLRADGSPATGAVVALHMTGRTIAGAEAKIEEDGYYRVTMRRDTRIEEGSEKQGPVLIEKELPEMERRRLLEVPDLTQSKKPPVAGPPEKPEPGKPDRPEPGKPEQPGPGKPEEPEPRPRPDGSVRVSVRQGDATIHTHPQAVTPRPAVVDYLDIVLPGKGKRSGPC